MATVKVKFRPSNVEGRPGVLFFQLIHNRSVKLITTKIRLFKHEWSQKEQEISINTADMERAVALHTLRSKLNVEKSRLKEIIGNLDKGHEYKVSEIVDRYQGTSTTTDFFSFMRKRILQLRAQGKERTSDIYRVTLNVFCSFIKERELPFDSIRSPLISDFEEHLLAKGLVKNSTSFYMRVLRTIYKRAVAQGITLDHAPFRSVYTGIDKTKKRALEDIVIKQLRELPDLSTDLALARDMFLFSFYTRGMSFVDMYHLKHENIHDDILTYRRAKTKQLLAIRVEQCIREIIDKYASHTKDTPYLLPLHGNSGKTAYKQQSNALRLYNKRLKILSERLSLTTSITSYTSRHTWASVAKNKGIPISVISEGMGHTSEVTTQIYLASFSQGVLDNANFKIISD